MDVDNVVPAGSVLSHSTPNFVYCINTTSMPPEVSSQSDSCCISYGANVFPRRIVVKKLMDGYIRDRIIEMRARNGSHPRRVPGLWRVTRATSLKIALFYGKRMSLGNESQNLVSNFERCFDLVICYSSSLNAVGFVIPTAMRRYLRF
jgi:hypothetical protein